LAPGERAKDKRRARLCGHACKSEDADYCRDCFDGRRQEIVEAKSPATPGQDSFVSTGDTAEVGKMTPEHVRTLADLVRVCQIDTSEWLVERWVANKWEVGTKDADGNVHTTPLFQVKAWLKRNRPLLDAKAEIAALVADAKKGMPKLAPAICKARKKSRVMLELNIADLHVGKLAWGNETGHGNYDSDIAEALHDRAVETILSRSSAYAPDEILIVTGNDLLHVDGRSNMTTGGTAQDTDSRYYKMFLSTRRMMSRMIDRCRSMASVRVSMVPGNHDRDSVWHLGDSLSCLYDKTSGVSIDNSASLRKYVEFGKVMLLLTHGNRGKAQDFPLLMATEQPEMFGRTVFREVHTGHLHQTRVQEHHGVRVRILPSLSGIDAWHAEYAFTGNIRAAESFVWSADEGLIATACFNAPVERAS
jgi:predicted phosphodiesterase